MKTIDQFCDALDTWMRRLCEQPRPGASRPPIADIIRHAEALDAAADAVADRDVWLTRRAYPLFFSVDDGEVSGSYAPADTGNARFALGIMDGLASRAADDSPIPVGHIGNPNARQLLDWYGSAAIEPLIACLRDALDTLRREWVRHEIQEWPRDDDGEEMVGEGDPPLRTAPIDTDDGAFEESGFATCASDAEHATEILRVDIDEDLLQPLVELIKQRGKAARAILRGEAA